VAWAFTLRSSPRRRFCRACSPSLLACTAFPRTVPEHVRRFPAHRVRAQFFPFGIDRASRCEIRCFSCSINAVILVVSPWSADHPPFVCCILRRMQMKPTKTTRAQILLSGRIFDAPRILRPEGSGHRGMKPFSSSKRTHAARLVPQRMISSDGDLGLHTSF